MGIQPKSTTPSDMLLPMAMKTNDHGVAVRSLSAIRSTP